MWRYVRFKNFKLFNIRMTILEFVTEKHRNQVRKYTNEPYVNHLIRVASNFEKDSYLYNLALCHDLFEDTDCTELELLDIYHETHPFWRADPFDNDKKFCSMVWELTDFFTSTRFPNDNRKQRKQWEIERLSQISSEAMTVKYADLMDNYEVIFYGTDFGKVYLQEKYEILKYCKQGDFNLYYKAIVKHNEMMKLI